MSDQPFNRSEHEANLMLALANNGVSAIDIWSIWNKVDQAQRDLGPLTEGQKADLILDNFADVRGTQDAHMVVDLLWGRVTA